MVLLMAFTSLLVGQMIERDDSQAVSVQLFPIPPKTKVHKLFFIFYRHIIWKYDEKCHLSLGCFSFPSPMLRRKSANFEDFLRSIDPMFCVSCNLVTICQRYEDFSVTSTISGLDPCRTTGKICRQSPAKSTASPQNCNDFFRISCILLSIYWFNYMLVSHREFLKFARSITLRSDKNRDYV